MFTKTSVIPILGAGAVLAIIGLVAARRELPRPRLLARRSKPMRAARRGMTIDSPGAASQTRRGALGALGAAASVEHTELPHETVLPIAFWDSAAEFDVDYEAQPAAPLSEAHGAYASIDAEDLGADWLTRATQTPLGHELDEQDDPAEIAADSMSMISEASRSAASAWADPGDELDDDEDRV